MTLKGYKLKKKDKFRGPSGMQQYKFETNTSCLRLSMTFCQQNVIDDPKGSKLEKRTFKRSLEMQQLKFGTKLSFKEKNINRLKSY